MPVNGFFSFVFKQLASSIGVPFAVHKSVAHETSFCCCFKMGGGIIQGLGTESSQWLPLFKPGGSRGMGVRSKKLLARTSADNKTNCAADSGPATHQRRDRKTRSHSPCRLGFQCCGERKEGKDEEARTLCRTRNLMLLS